MARATHLTIGTADCIRLDARGSDPDGNDHDYDGNDHDEDGQDEVRQEVQVSVTYALDAEDTDLTALAEEKAGEVQRAHAAAWHRIGALGSSADSCTSPRCRDGNDDDTERSEETEAGEEPDDIPAKQSWYLPGASRLQEGAGSPEPVLAADSQSAEPLTGPQKILIRSRAARAGLTAYALETLLFQQFKVWRVERLSKAQAASLLVALERDLKERETEEKQERKNATEGSHLSAV